MSATRGPRDHLLMALIAVAGVAAPFLMPDLRVQLVFLWVMVVFALTWDIMGGQMGYNSFGNVLFFGVGMYACAVVQRDSGLPYGQALAVGIAIGIVLSVVCAAVLGAGLLALRGHYFAIGTLAIAFAAGEIANGWEYVGAGGGMTTPEYPGAHPNLFFYFCMFVLAVLTFLTLRRLYASRFGLAINAIRDDEDKAEAMGVHTTRYKTVAWCVSAVFLSVAGGLVGNVNKFIDPLNVAFAGATYGVWMVLMPILGGKGTIWGPVLGAVVFDVTQELFWTYLLGWQRVALGLVIVVIVVFFPLGILGWARERWPERFGHRVEPAAGGPIPG